MSDRWGPSEDCPKCGQPHSYGWPCPNGCDENEEEELIEDVSEGSELQSNDLQARRLYRASSLPDMQR